MRADLARLREMERAATPGEWSEHLGIILAPRVDGARQAVSYAADEWRHVGGLPLYQQATANAAFIVALKNQFPALADRMERMEAALQYAVELAKEAHSHWDADRDVKVGKLLMALAGYIKGYDPRADKIHAALAEPAQGEKEA